MPDPIPAPLAGMAVLSAIAAAAAYLYRRYQALQHALHAERAARRLTDAVQARDIEAHATRIRDEQLLADTAAIVDAELARLTPRKDPEQ